MTGKAKMMKSRRPLSLLLAVLFTIGLLPPVKSQAVTGIGTQEDPYIFTAADGAVVLTEEYSGSNVIIQNGVFSVTVKDATDVTIIFDNVTIDRRPRTDTAAGGLSGTAVPGLYAAYQKLGWTDNKAPVCPFLITGNSTVTAGFYGTCTFYAGTNSSTVDSSNVYTAYYVTNNNNHTNKGCGYAGIQVDKDATLTIQYAEKLTVYGAHQLDNPGSDGKVSNGMLYSDVLRANASISDAGYVNPYGTELYNVLNSHEQFAQSGGAGIGGGAAYDTPTSEGANYSQGTPGTIIINGGNIEAFGGYAAAGIGGGVNSAATSSSITINGGNVIAHGGRFAAGIGDGDSVPRNEGGMSSQLIEATGRIEINGGSVTSYGGVAAPGIGCSDDICEGSKGYGEDARSQLEIAINGGSVHAFSGFPSGYTGGTNFPTEAPAAIGAGSISQMESNSIYISSEADLLCAAFGNYSLTEIGTNGSAIPTINVDSSGYLLLLKTGNYYAKQERVLQLWKPQTADIPGIGTCVKYTIQETGKIYYCCDDEDGNRIVYEKNGDNYLRVTEQLEGLTLYKDEKSEPLIGDDGNPIEIKLAYFFRSMAITLPEPEKHGGLYAITVPMDGVTTNNKPGENAPIILTVEAYQQGTQSGTITYPSNHNMSLDDTADRLTDLDAYTETTVQLPADGLIGKEFEPGVFAYTVYVEPTINEVTLRAEFEDNHTTYSVSLDGTPLPQTDLGDSIQVSSVIDLSEGQSKTVRLKKQDGDNTLGAIVYKVTIIKKSNYELELSDPTKTYDGTPVNVTATGVGEYATVYFPEDVPSATLPSNTTSGLEERNVTYNSTVFLGQRYGTSNVAAVAMTLNTIVSGQNAMQYILTVTTSQNSGTVNNRGTWYAGWEVDYESSDGSVVTRLTTRPNNNYQTNRWIGDASERIASGNNNNNSIDLNLVLDNTGTAKLQIGNGDPYTIFSIDTVTPLDARPVNDRIIQERAARAAIKNGATSGSFPYANYTESGSEQNLTIQTVQRNGTQNTAAPQEVTPVTLQSTRTYTEAGTWEIASKTQFLPVSLPPEDLEQVKFTYYQTHDHNGEKLAEEKPLGEVAPTDVGEYRVDAVLRATTYNAAGSQPFTIKPREVRVQQITNWLLYLKTEPKPGTLPITEPGAIMLENVVGADAKYVSINYESVNVFYNETSLSYNSDKITLEDAVLIGDRAFNYYLHYDDQENKLIFVFGQIALDVQGSTFRKTADGEWRKYYPQSDGDPVGHEENPADYHSPEIDGVYRVHSEYVLARTVNQDSGTRYAVDIEYGAMQFGFFHSWWDVNQLAYVENKESFWTGMDGENNRIVLNNYSNAEVFYQVSATIDFLYAALGNSNIGITAKITSDEEGYQSIGKTTWTSVAAATPGNSVNIGSSGSEECYLFLSGVPQMPESSTYIEVGAIKVTIAPRDMGSS